MNCSVLTSAEYGHLSVARGASGGVCFLLAIATAVASFLAYRFKPTPKGFLDHLFLYLTVITILHTGLYVVEMGEEAVGNRSSFCKALGFFLEWIGWVQLSTTCLLILCLVYLLVKVVNYPSPSAERMQFSMTVSQSRARESTRLKRRHYLAVLLGWTPVPLIFTWVPLYTTERYEAKHWCWIASISEDCSGNRAAFIEEIVLWYTPVLIAAGCSLCLGILMAATYGWWACWQDKRLRENIPRNLLLTGFIFLFSALCGVELAARTHTAVYKTHHYGVWMAYAILSPWRDLALPLGYSLYLRAWCWRNTVSLPPTDSEREDDELERSAFVNIETVTARDRRALLVNSKVPRSNTVT